MASDKGLYQKYTVTRIDGKEMAQGCFVLELKDPVARKAILAYSNELTARGLEPSLAYDLKAWVSRYDTPAANPEELPDAKPDTITFGRTVLIKKGKPVTEDTLYVVAPEDVDEYIQEDDLELSATLTVNMQNYYDYMEGVNGKEEEDNSIVGNLVKDLVKECIESGLAADLFWDMQKGSIEKYFKEHSEKVKATFFKDMDF